ncbi:helix-turn-helix domain-containing protein [Mucilaginibacter sp.]|uniref:helix-turn-helix domain-containing protein n=1 Tax=Mucilaginibacter sp. TaxID=1882438 RepID=UPI003562FE24
MLNKEDQDIFYKKLGELIRAARKKSGLTQDDVADHLGLTRISIVNFEQGTQKIQLHALLELSGLLNINVGEFLAPLYVITTKNITLKTEKSITKEVAQLADKDLGAEILKGFLKYSKYKK